MCGTCGCSDGASAVRTVEVHEPLLGANDRAAQHNRQHFRADGVLAVNVMGSPGSGKTALLEATPRHWPTRRFAALNGDLATDYDARRLSAAGIAAGTITTGSVCHLEAEMVHEALHELRDPYDVLFLENVGNLVCPAIFDLGQEVNVVVLLVTEGADKPIKYPVMFRRADMVVLTKIDLIPHLGDVTVAAFEDALARVMPRPAMLPVSSRTGEGMRAWADWLEACARHVQQGDNRGRGTTGSAGAGQRDQAPER